MGKLVVGPDVLLLTYRPASQQPDPAPEG